MTKLERTYVRYNRRYFNGQLPEPPDIRIKWARIDDCGDWDGETISINQALRKWHSVWKCTLLHELCHVATDDEIQKHGPRFKKEMKRLFMAGAFNRIL